MKLAVLVIVGFLAAANAAPGFYDGGNVEINFRSRPTAISQKAEKHIKKDGVDAFENGGPRSGGPGFGGPGPGPEYGVPGSGRPYYGGPGSKGQGFGGPRSEGPDFGKPRPGGLESRGQGSEGSGSGGPESGAPGSGRPGYGGPSPSAPWDDPDDIPFPVNVLLKALAGESLDLSAVCHGIQELDWAKYREQMSFKDFSEFRSKFATKEVIKSTSALAQQALASLSEILSKLYSELELGPRFQAIFDDLVYDLLSLWIPEGYLDNKIYEIPRRIGKGSWQGSRSKKESKNHGDGLAKLDKGEAKSSAPKSGKPGGQSKPGQPRAAGTKPGAAKPKAGDAKQKPGAVKPQLDAWKSQKGAWDLGVGPIKPKAGATKPESGLSKPQAGVTKPEAGITQGKATVNPSTAKKTKDGKNLVPSPNNEPSGYDTGFGSSSASASGYNQADGYSPAGYSEQDDLEYYEWLNEHQSGVSEAESSNYATAVNTPSGKGSGLDTAAGTETRLSGVGYERVAGYESEARVYSRSESASEAGSNSGAESGSRAESGSAAGSGSGAGFGSVSGSASGSGSSSEGSGTGFGPRPAYGFGTGYGFGSESGTGFGNVAKYSGGAERLAGYNTRPGTQYEAGTAAQYGSKDDDGTDAAFNDNTETRTRFEFEDAAENEAATRSGTSSGAGFGSGTEAITAVRYEDMTRTEGELGTSAGVKFGSGGGVVTGPAYRAEPQGGVRYSSAPGGWTMTGTGTGIHGGFGSGTGAGSQGGAKYAAIESWPITGNTYSTGLQYGAATRPATGFVRTGTEVGSGLGASLGSGGGIGTGAKHDGGYGSGSGIRFKLGNESGLLFNGLKTVAAGANQKSLTFPDLKSTLTVTPGSLANLWFGTNQNVLKSGDKPLSHSNDGQSTLKTGGN